MQLNQPYKFRSTISLISFLMVFILANSAKSEQSFQDLFKESTSKQAYEKVEPIIKNIPLNTSIDISPINIRLFKKYQGRKIVGYVAYSDGWLGALSGGAIGGATKFGKYVCRNENKAFGKHVFGYSVDGITIIPRYIFITAGEIISKTEFDRISNSGGFGVWRIFNGNNEDMFVKDIALVDKYEVKSNDIEGFMIKEEVPKSKRKSTIKNWYSQQKYESVKINLSNIEVGTDFVEFMTRNGLIVDKDGGDSYVLWLPGFLNYKGEYRWCKETTEGFFDVWPFGYVHRDREVPEVAVIFKNDKFFKTVPYASKLDIEKVFN